MNAQQKAQEKVNTFFNDERVFLPKEEWVGDELRVFFKVPTENKLFKEEPGKHPDTLIAPEAKIKVKNGDKFYDLPPGVKGLC